MTLMRSCTPLTPCGILVKSSLPIAFCFVVKGRWSDATMFRVSLGREKDVTNKGKEARVPEGGDRCREKCCLRTRQSCFQSQPCYLVAV